LGAAWSIRSLEGAHLNDLIPAYAGISILAGLGLHRLLEAGGGEATPPWRGALPDLAWALVLVQFVLLGYDPRPHLPTAADREAGEAVVARIRAIEGEVFIPGYGYLARLAGKRGTAHASAISDVGLDRSRDVSRKLHDQIGEALEAQRFAALIGAKNMSYRGLIRRFYRRREPIQLPRGRFLPVEGAALRPEAIYFRGSSSISR
jgi:hypothetical protein